MRWRLESAAAVELGAAGDEDEAEVDAAICFYGSTLTYILQWALGTN